MNSGAEVDSQIRRSGGVSKGSALRRFSGALRWATYRPEGVVLREGSVALEPAVPLRPLVPVVDVSLELPELPDEPDMPLERVVLELVPVLLLG